MDLSEWSVSELSDLSDISYSDNVKNNQSGGFFGLFSSINKVDQAALEAARLKKYDIIDFMIDKDIISSFGSQDSSGNSLLHYMAENYDNTSDIINKMFKKSEPIKYINIQNNNGDTPMLFAVKAGHHDLCTLLCAKGADKGIKNNQGYKVDTETEDINNDEQVFAKPLSPSMIENEATQNKTLEPVLNLLRPRRHNTTTSEPITMNLDTQAMTEKERTTDDFVNQLQNKLKQDGGNYGDSYGGGCGCNDTETLIQKLQSHIVMNGGSVLSDTDTLINRLCNDMSGGKRTKKAKKTKGKKANVRGNRQIPKFREGDINDDDDDHGSELGRIINNQTTEVINKVIKMIQDIIVKNKKEFDKVSKDVGTGSEQVAKVYKAALWSMVKDDPSKPGKSPLDIAVGMEKLLSKDVLLKINYKDWADKLKKHYEEKEKNMKTKESGFTNESDTSDEDVEDVDLSETSA